ncbi:hypothetical protein LBMAG42_37490 [Deltaproteobacteria bacterium]|nr:hypothetical protein LBMAG42_37490 [Deltaproteobacteria bacterium]
MATLLLLLAGCSNAVRFSEIDEFGEVRSAVWLHETTGRSVADSIVLTTVPDLCLRYGHLVEAAAVLAGVLAALEAEDTSCADLAAPAENFGAAAADLWYEGASYLIFNVLEDGDGAPQAQHYAVGDPEQSVSGEVEFVLRNPFGGYLEDWDEQGSLDDNCGAGFEPDFDGSFARWSVSAGDLEITEAVEGAGVAGAFDGEIEDTAGDNAGDARVRLDAGYCAVVSETG